MIPMKLNTVIWVTGLSCSGKTTLASGLANYFHHIRLRYFWLDGDRLRSGLNSDLSFTREHRRENVRRVAEVAAMMAYADVPVIVSVIAPYKEDRLAARKIIEHEGNHYKLIYMSTPLAVCMTMDSHGKYERALKGDLPHFTGVDDPYEEPKEDEYDLRLDTRRLDVIGERHAAQRFNVKQVIDIL